MDEFTNYTRRQAAGALQALSGQQPTPEFDPILELVAFLLEESTSQPGREAELTMEEWFLWNQLAMDQTQELVQAMNAVLEMEQAPLPMERAAMASWAAWLVASTLDHLETE